jgi:hypothetical protein
VGLKIPREERLRRMEVRGRAERGDKSLLYFIACQCSTRTRRQITVTKDDSVGAGIAVKSLSRIKPAFAKDGSIHGGNAG